MRYPKFGLKVDSYIDWCSSNLGRAIAEIEQVALNNLSMNFFGNYLLQLGGSDNVDFANFSHTHKKIYLNNNLHSLPGSHCGYSICSDFTDLPFLPLSIDAVLAFHVLQGNKQPDQILSEISEILVEEGYLVIFEFNPYSLLGLQHLLTRDIRNLNHEKMYSSHQIRKWLGELGFSVIDYQTLFFRPACENKKILQKFLFLEGLGAMFFSDLGGVSMLVAQKKVFGVTPLKQRVHVRDAMPVAIHA